MGMISRTTLLPPYLAQMRQRALRPGHHDCALFAAGWVQICTGVDLAATWRGQYSTLAQGQALMVQQGYADHIDMAAQHLTEIDGWMQAQTGDIAVIVEGDEMAMGVIGGAFIHVPGLHQLVAAHLRQAVRVFRP